MSDKITFRSKLKYKFDNYMAAGPKSIFLSLLILFFVAFLVTAFLRYVVDISFFVKPGANDTLFKDIWLAFLQITDPGAMAEDGNKPFGLKVVGIITVFLGLIFFSAVVAFITTQLDQKIEDLKKGRSTVVEKDHVIILGWNSMVVEIIRELIEANESEKSAAIAILAEKPKEEMDDYLNEMLTDRKTTKVITRNGHPSSLEALQRVQVTESKSVIILPTCNESATDEEKVISDAKVLKSILAVVAASRNDPTRANIIAEIFDRNKRHVMVNLDPEKITMVETEQIVAKIIVQTSRTSGLAFVYEDIIGFMGSEIYFYNAEWNNETFGELQFHFPDGIPLGVRPESGEIILNPEMSYTVKPNDEIIILAEDDSTIAYKKSKLFEPTEFSIINKKRKKTTEKELIIGWNSKASIIISEYTDYILSGSTIDIILTKEEEKAMGSLKDLKKQYPNINIRVLKYNPMEMKDLEKIKPYQYDNVILLNRIEDDMEKIDSTTITILLLIKEVFKRYTEKTGKEVTTQLITEVMNSENLELIAKTGVNDSIISYRMISKIFAQVAENPDILQVYDDLFSEEGSEIYLKPLSLYLQNIPESCTFADLMLIAQKRGEVLLGYRFKEYESDVKQNFGVFVNIPKDTVIHPQAEDHMVVLSEDEL